MFRSPQHWNWRYGRVGALLAVLLGLCCLWLTPFEGAVNLGYELPFLLRPNLSIDSNNVVIVYMDQESHIRLSQERHGVWNRELHAQLINRMTSEGARAVAFDILFIPTTNSLAEAAVVRAARGNGRVIVAARRVADLFHGEVIGFHLEFAFPALKAEVKVFSGVVEESGAGVAVRQHYRNVDDRQPSLAWQTARLITNTLPDPYQQRWVNYYGPPGIIPSISYYQALEDDPIRPGYFSNKVVFVGARYDLGFSGGKGTDDFRTPYTRITNRKSPGVEVNATVFLNLVRGDWLRRLPPYLEVGLVVAAGVVLGFGLAPCRPMRASVLAAGAAILVSILGMVLAWQSNPLLVPWFIIAGIQTPVALAWCVLAHSGRLNQEKKALEQVYALLKRGDPGDTASEAPTALPGFEPRLPLPGHPSESYSASSLPAVPKPSPLPQQSMPIIPNHQLLTCIGQGAYGEVWLATDIIGTFHAVKVVHRRSFKDARPLEREFHGLTKFTPISRSHPGFVHILHVGRNERPEYIYYVMELSDDESGAEKVDPQTYVPRSLARVLQRRKRLPLAECVQISIQLADALQYLHQQQLIHRDIKPANILFVKGAPKFADVGLVTSVATEGASVTYVGTPGRIAPEGPGTPAADVFSFGKVIYEMGIGLPLERFPELPTTLVEGIEDEGLFDLNRIIMKACEMNVRNRYQSAEELRADLVKLRSRHPVVPQT